MKEYSDAIYVTIIICSVVLMVLMILDSKSALVEQINRGTIGLRHVAEFLKGFFDKG